jgi:hypothetical protein
MSTIIRLHREYRDNGGRGLHVAVGRPLEIIVAVPWGDSFHLARGAVLSYYELWRPLDEVLGDTEWKLMTQQPWLAHRHRPWLLQHDVGLPQQIWTRQQLLDWLPEESDRWFGRSFSQLLDEQSFAYSTSQFRSSLAPLGWVQLDAPARQEAGHRFAHGRFDEATRYTLYLWLRDAAPDLRRSVAMAATTALQAEIEEQHKALSSRDHDLWLFLARQLVRDLDDAELQRRFQALIDHRDTVSADR